MHVNNNNNNNNNNIKVKTAIKLYANEDSTMRMVREFEEKRERTGR